MARIFPICSSSSANATFIGTKGHGILIDAGCSFRALKNSLELIDTSMSQIEAGAGRGPLPGAEDIIRRTTTMKIAVIYWSGTGNTEAMASAVAEGAGAELYSVSQFSGDVSEYDRLAFGCPAMGAENLEEGEFEPFFEGIESKLSGKKVALFGSYGWGDGEWMREWAERVRNDGAVLVNDEGLIVNETPDDAALADCKALGAKLAE